MEIVGDENSANGIKIQQNLSLESKTLINSVPKEINARKEKDK